MYIFFPDVDVEKPDEKSIMTYVAKFLEKYPDQDYEDDAAKVRYLFPAYLSSLISISSLSLISFSSLSLISLSSDRMIVLVLDHTQFYDAAVVMNFCMIMASQNFTVMI